LMSRREGRVYRLNHNGFLRERLVYGRLYKALGQ
jgi:hypothetical protein